MLAACASPPPTADRRPTRHPRTQDVAATLPARPARFTRTELVTLLRDYRAAPGLTPAQRREAVAWITGHQAEET